ncbi:MAG: glycosyltransferase [Lachnospiraceae bacterium]|jgi:glycosyltransferase involved in cell wall biosynthesis|nr:glycosyltransferase [Lachnospiraceae bacterium]
MSRHIVLYIGSLQAGGAERVLVNLAEGLFARGWRVTFVTTYYAEKEYGLESGCWREARSMKIGERARFIDALDPLDCPVRLAFPEDAAFVTSPSGQICGAAGDDARIGRVFSGVAMRDTGGRIKGFFKRLKSLKWIIRELRPDVILSFIGKNNMMAILASDKGRIPVVVSVRATPDEEYPTNKLKLAANALFPRAAAVAVQSQAAADWFSDKVRKRAVVLPNMVAQEFFEPGEEAPREKSIVFVGRLDENKNASMLLRAFSKIPAQEAEGWRVMVYGDGEDKSYLQRVASELRIADKVRFLGQRRGIAERIRHAGIYCLVSHQEGMPNTLLEAMCLGLPCIATDCVYGGIGQFVTDGVNALVIRKDNEAALTAALRRLMGNSALAEKLGENARKIREKYERSAVLDAWEEVLEHAASENASQREGE